MVATCQQFLFHSSLEARWSVFFDALGISYDYEHEGLDGDGGWYLPDFWIPGACYYIEVKACEDGIAKSQIGAYVHYARESDGKFMVIIGGPVPGEYDIWSCPYLDDPCETGAQFAQCPECGSLFIASPDRIRDLPSRGVKGASEEKHSWCALFLDRDPSCRACHDHPSPALIGLHESLALTRAYSAAQQAHIESVGHSVRIR